MTGFPTTRRLADTVGADGSDVTAMEDRAMGVAADERKTSGSISDDGADTATATAARETAAEKSATEVAVGGITTVICEKRKIADRSVRRRGAETDEIGDGASLSTVQKSCSKPQRKDPVKKR
mmetsp:Transcript_39138/g.76358  ORF Transcript_39138/g.76358 Transcript_39138/m.76358 type:complete len:123 (+) Transcript_39138:284-652(+)